jgi:hypothetical protein
MFCIRNVPVAIEPGVDSLEAEFAVSDPKRGDRIVPVQLCRVPADEKTVGLLPLIPSTRQPHVFSLIPNLKKSAALVVYDFLGRISLVFTRGEDKRSWEKHEVADEHAGRSVTQFSVRFAFGNKRDRDKFLELMEKMTKQAMAESQPNTEEIMTALRLLGRSRVAPTVLPVAVDKNKLSKVKL